MAKKRIEITIEQHRIWRIQTTAPTPLVWCAICQKETLMVRLASAARLAGLTERALFGRLQAGLVHFSETPDGVLHICVNSIQNEEQL